MILSDIVDMTNFLHFPQLLSYNFKDESEIPCVQYRRIFSVMAFTVEDVKRLLQRDLVTE